MNPLHQFTATSLLLSTLVLSACQSTPSTPGPTATSTPTASTAPSASPEPTPSPTPKASPSPEPTPDTSAVPSASPEPTPEPTPEASATPDPTPEPTTEPTPEPLRISGFIDIENIAGNGEEGSAETGLNADETPLPEDIIALASDSEDNIFMLTQGNGVLGYITKEIKRESSQGTLDYRLYWDSQRNLQRVTGMTYDKANKLFYIVQQSLHQVSRYNPENKELTVIAGTGQPGFKGDGPATERPLQDPTDVALDAEGNVYITDTGNHLIRKITPDGQMITFAGQYKQDTRLPDDADEDDLPSLEPVGDTTGDGGPVAEALLESPEYIAVDSAGQVYFTSKSQTIRRIAGGQIDKYAGSGQVGYNGNNFRADLAHIHNPGPLRFGPDGLLYFVDRNNLRVRRIQEKDGQRVIQDMIGSGRENKSSSVVADPLKAELRPSALTFDSQGNLYVYDAKHRRLRVAKRQVETQ